MTCYSSVNIRSYIKFKTFPNIDENLPIIDATITLGISPNTNTGKRFSVHRVTQSWTTDYITYAQQPASDTGYLDYWDFTPGVTLYPFSIYCDAVCSNFADVMSKGFMIRYTDESNNSPDYNAFCTSNYPDSYYCPCIWVCYGYQLPSTLNSGYSYYIINSSSEKAMYAGSNVYQYNHITDLHETFRITQTSSSSDAYAIWCAYNDYGICAASLSSGANVYLNTGTYNSTTQEWIIVGIGTNKFKIVSRVDTTLALSTNSASNGTNSGTSSTSTGNIYLSTYCGSAYQQWYFYTGFNYTPITYDIPMFNSSKTYYINNCNTGKFLIYNTSSDYNKATSASGTINSLGNKMGWKFYYQGDGYYLIQSINDKSKYLYVNNTYGLCLGIKPNSTKFHWQIHYNTSYNGYYLYNSETGYYIGLSSSGPILSTSLSFAYMWEFCESEDYYERELTSVSFNYSTKVLNIGDSFTNSYSYTARNTSYTAKWSTSDKFKYTISSTTYCYSSFNYSTGEIHVIAPGTVYITITHIPTGITVTYAIIIYAVYKDASLIGIIDNSGGHEHVTIMSDIYNHLNNLGLINVSLITADSIDKWDFITQATTSRMLVFKNHGSKTSILLDNTNDFGINVSEMNNLDENACNLDLVVYACCSAGEGGVTYSENNGVYYFDPTGNFVNVTYSKGAKIVIGWKIEVVCAQSNYWLNAFYNYFESYNTTAFGDVATVLAACNYADYATNYYYSGTKLTAANRYVAYEDYINDYIDNLNN